MADPDDIIYEIVQLGKFCIERDLPYSIIQGRINDLPIKQGKAKGWRLIDRRKIERGELIPS